MNITAKMTSLFLGLIMLSLNVLGQNFLPIKEGTLWGAINLQGETTVKPVYSYIGDFTKDNLAIVSKEGKNGLINGQGDAIIAPTYKKIRFINDSYLTVCDDNGCALASINGQILSPFKHQAIFAFNEVLFKTYKAQQFGLISNEGSETLPAVYDKVYPYPENPNLIQISSQGKTGIVSPTGNIILEAIYDEITITNKRVDGKKGSAITSAWLTENNEVSEKKEFPNQMALRIDTDARLKKKQIALLQNDPEAKKPRWVLNTFRYSLENGVGKNLLNGKEFFDVGIDEQLQRSLAREVIPPKEKGEEEKIISYLINHSQAKVILTAQVKDMVISDFNLANYARVTIDTLWDGLIDKEGNILKEIAGKSITNIGNFNNGLAWVKSGKSYGFINAQGKIVIPLIYQIVSDFENGYAVAKKDNLFGCIDTKGNAVIPFIYDGIDIPKNGICRVKKGRGREGRWGAVNLQNKQIISFNYSLIYPFKDGVARMRQGRNWGLITEKGKIIIAPSITCDYLGDFTNGIAMVGMERWVEKTPSGPLVRYKKQGYIKQDGTYLIEPVYDKIEGFEEIWQKQEGLARIYKNEKVGYVNYQGTIELKAVYDDTYRFDTVWRNNNGISKIKKEGKYGYIDHNSQEILAPVYDEISPFFMQVGQDSSGVALVKKDGKFGYVNYEGKVVIPIQYDYASEIVNGIVPIKLNGKWGAVDTLNNKVLAFDFDGARFLEGSGQKLIELLKKEKAYFELDAQGRFIKEVAELTNKKDNISYSKSTKFNYVSEFDNDGFAAVDKNGKVALINSKGELLTKYKYKEIAPFSEGLALVRLAAKERKDQLYGFIDQQGNEIIKPQFKQAKSFGGGHAAVLNRSTWGFINKQGKMVISPKFKNPGLFSGGYAIINKNEIYDKNGNKAGLFVLNGTIAKGFSNERAIVQSTSGEYHITPEGMPAYFAKYDEVTPFVGKIAFAKRGEVWELKRKTGEYTNKLKFSRANRNSYLSQYGERRKETLQDGTILEDIEWVLLEKGTWKMIDADGNFLSDIVFKHVTLNETGKFVVSIENRSGLADLKGNLITEPKYEVIKAISKDIVRLEKAGEIGYLDTNGKWLRKID